jgi:hypothetical protein
MMMGNKGRNGRKSGSPAWKREKRQLATKIGAFLPFDGTRGRQG